MAPAACVQIKTGMCNKLHYNAFRNNAANIRHDQCFCQQMKRETFSGQNIGFINHLNFVEAPKKDKTS